MHVMSSQGIAADMWAVHDKWVSIWADDKAFLFFLLQQNSFRGMTDLLGHGYIIMAADKRKMDRLIPARPNSSTILIYVTASVFASCTYVCMYVRSVT